MTIMNVYVSPERALIGTDTKAVSIGGQVVEASKAFPIAHANTVIVATGILVFAQLLYLRVQEGLSAAGGFDEIAAAMPEALEVTMEAVLQRGSREPEMIDAFKRRLDRQNVCCVGWSESRQQFQGYLFSNADSSQGWKLEEVDLYYVAMHPFHSSLMPLMQEFADNGGAEDLIRLSRAQAAMGSEAFPEVANLDSYGEETPCGGRLVSIEVTPHRMVIDSSVRLGPVTDIVPPDAPSRSADLCAPMPYTEA